MNTLKIRDTIFNWGKRTYIMGILNVTPDSFSDGGEYHSPDKALKQAQSFIEAGVDIIDVGGQSTRPGSQLISTNEEIDRVIPIIELLRSRYRVPISLDTINSKVAEAGIEAGADIINDISGGTLDPEMLPTAAKLAVPIILMHSRGTPKTMQTLTQYENLVSDIISFLETQISKAINLGIHRHNIIIDPGIGFAKTYEQNLEILQNLPRFHCLDFPLLVGVSRKSFIGYIINKQDPKDRLWGTIAACCYAIAAKTHILRVHDVTPMIDATKVADKLWRN
ncbi:MAG: Dihydropteroate synthase [Chroococcopsis gigantea SAG 12.99]|jgi:dihydropteroate synthase|nr:dihydropteroate synthase [Chlorogloea purpurea SAG 13.99]MDV3001210.1 Dihydropteroate synthase [Chroococcopsis gigantea SAG 12.99]